MLSLRWATHGRFESAFEMEKLVATQKSRCEFLSQRPKISIGCVYRGESDLKLSIESLLAQSYADWELLVVADGSVDVSHTDPRVRIIETHFSTSADAKNAAVAAAQGEWFGVLDPGDALSPVALFQFVYWISRNPECSFFYCNEAEMEPSTKDVSNFWSKGAPSWFNLVHFNSVGRFFLAKSSSLQEGAFNPKESPEEELGMILKQSLLSSEWKHIPEYLYYRSEEPLSNIIKRREIVEHYLNQRGIRAYVGTLGTKLDVQPVLENPEQHLISAIIPFKDKADMTLKCLEALARQRGEVPLEVFLVNNQSNSEVLGKLKAAIKGFDFPVTVLEYPKSFNFGDMNNTAIQQHSKGDFLLLLNNDVYIQGSRSLDNMAAWAQFSWAGTVGLRLVYEHGATQHSGFDAHFGGFSRMARVGNGQGRDRFAFENHEVFGSTFACCMIKRSTFDDIGPFRTVDLANGFGDIAFNFECVRKGMRNLYLGTLWGYHLESVSRGETYEYWEECTLEREYSDILQKMLREDLAVDRLPGNEDAVFDVLKESALGTLRKHAPWLKTVKRQIEKKIRPQSLEVT